jgi:hypothetical protein
MAIFGLAFAFTGGLVLWAYKKPAEFHPWHRLYGGLAFLAGSGLLLSSLMLAL